uniref:Uncharacterized protein n=1 Tax=Arion vulgaris TaxID=1028688 RepID=A0A0B7A2A0_9EUPU
MRYPTAMLITAAIIDNEHATKYIQKVRSFFEKLISAVNEKRASSNKYHDPTRPSIP